jgi:hypothetical protein
MHTDLDAARRAYAAARNDPSVDVSDAVRHLAGVTALIEHIERDVAVWRDQLPEVKPCRRDKDCGVNIGGVWCDPDAFTAAENRDDALTTLALAAWQDAQSEQTYTAERDAREQRWQAFYDAHPDQAAAVLADAEMEPPA